MVNEFVLVLLKYEAADAQHHKAEQQAKAKLQGGGGLPVQQNGAGEVNDVVQGFSFKIARMVGLPMMLGCQKMGVM